MLKIAGRKKKLLVLNLKKYQESKFSYKIFRLYIKKQRLKQKNLDYLCFSDAFALTFAFSFKLPRMTENLHTHVTDYGISNVLVSSNVYLLHYRATGLFSLCGLRGKCFQGGMLDDQPLKRLFFWYLTSHSMFGTRYVLMKIKLSRTIPYVSTWQIGFMHRFLSIIQLLYCNIMETLDVIPALFKQFQNQWLAVIY